MERLTVGALAKQAGVNVQTIRYYEREGLLAKPPRTSGGYRAFPVESVARVRFIKRAQEIGFSLNDARELLELRDHPETACPEVLRRTEAKVRDVAEKVRHLQAIQRELTRLANACAGKQSPHSCPLLDALEHRSRAEKAIHDHPTNGKSGMRNQRPVESSGSRFGTTRGAGAPHRPTGAAGAGRRRGMGG